MSDQPIQQPDASLPMGPTDLPIIGIEEYVALPDWGIKHLRAKTDTGARTSAIDAYDIQELDDNRVRFMVVYSRKHPEHRREVVAEITRRAKVKSSTGHQHERLFVTTTLKVGPVEKTIEVSLISRHKMKARMLIGRMALAGDFLVDPQRDRLLTKRPVRRKKKKRKPKT
ncbi:MAG: ATP-dependent zinc protease [Phycisphaeraceae bacterium]